MTVKNYKFFRKSLNILTFCIARHVASFALLLGVILIFNFFIFNFVYAATFGDVVDNIVGLLNGFLGVLIGLAVLFTVYAALKYLIAGGDQKARAEGVRLLTWGIIGVAVMVSVWGVVAVVVNTFFDPSDLSSPGSSEDLLDSRLRPN